MSKIKQSILMELDVTDPRDSFTPPDEPTLEDLYLNTLINTLRALEGVYMGDYLPELTECRHRLEKLYNTAGEAPF